MPETHSVGDEQLRELFACCHPTLPARAQMATALHLVVGLDADQVGHTLLRSTSDANVLVLDRARLVQLVAELPADAALVDRAGRVLQIVYLIYNAAYSGLADDASDRLAEHALLLARQISEFMPDDPEALGLCALIQVQHSRRAARIDSNGDLVTLADQDRMLWDASMIASGIDDLARARRHDQRGPYQLQATISALHATASDFEHTDWPSIVGLYDQLRQLTPSPVVELNRAVAYGMDKEPKTGLALIDVLAETEPELSSYHLLHAARADFARRLGHADIAAAAYKRALQMAPIEGERRFLKRRIDELEAERPR